MAPFHPGFLDFSNAEYTGVNSFVKNYSLSLPMKKTAMVPGPECEPITGPI